LLTVLAINKGYLLNDWSCTSFSQNGLLSRF